MNAAAKALQQAYVTPTSIIETLTHGLALKLVLLITLTFLSGFGVIYVSDMNRHLVSTLQNEEQIAQNLRVEHDELLLEQSTLAQPSRVARIAENQLDMILPASKNVIIIKQ